MRTKKVNLGIVNLGENVMISDPCYGVQTWCNSLVLEVAKGKYNALVRIGKDGQWGERVTELTLCHESHKPFTALKHLEHHSAFIGVDSGTCGIYDLDYFESNHDDHSSDEDWYQKNVMNDFYYTKEQAFITDGKGVHSCSGYGDGMYHAYVKRNENNKVFQITIKFI